MIWQNVTETCIIFCLGRVTSPGPMPGAGCLALVHWDDPEGWCGDGGKRGVLDGENVYTRAGFMLMCGRAIAILWRSWPPIKINKFMLK